MERSDSVEKSPWVCAPRNSVCTPRLPISVLTATLWEKGASLTCPAPGRAPSTLSIFQRWETFLCLHRISDLDRLRALAPGCGGAGRSGTGLVLPMIHLLLRGSQRMTQQRRLRSLNSRRASRGVRGIHTGGCCCSNSAEKEGGCVPAFASRGSLSRPFFPRTAGVSLFYCATGSAPGW